MKLTSWVFLLRARLSYGILMPSLPTLYINAFSDPGSENADGSGTLPTGKSELCPGSSEEGLGKSHNRDTQVPFTSMVHCQGRRYLYALYNPLFVCYANNLWGWSWNVQLTQSHCCAIEMGQSAAHFPCCPEAGWLLPFEQASATIDRASKSGLVILSPLHFYSVDYSTS